MIDTKVFCSKIKYQRVAEHECLNNTISDKKIINNNMNINLNIIKNINNTNKNDYKAVDAKTLSSPWFCPKMSRSQATSILKSSSVGSFLVRKSVSQGSSFALSVRVPGVQVQHHLLLVGDVCQGVNLYGSKKLFPSIYSLITHLSIMKECLPCILHIDNTDSDASEESEDGEDIIDIDSEPELEEIVTRMQKQMTWK